MKDYFNLRKSKLLLLTLLSVLVGGVSPAWADEVTVYDGTSTNNYIPTYGYYADTQGELSEFVIPSSDLSGVSGNITALKFYSSSTTKSWGAAQYKVYLKEVSDGVLATAFSGDTDATTVYEGALSIASNKMSIDFTTEYAYKGGNLLVGIYVSTKGTYSDASFYGVKGDNIVSRYRSSASGNGTAQYFTPKTTITYEIPVTGPGLAVKDGSTKLTTGHNYNFGLATAGTEKTFTLSNPGTESITVNIEATNGFGVNPASATIDAKDEATLTVTMADATATGAVTITPTATSVDAFTINVSGTIRDANKVYLDFADGQMPEGWTSVNTGNYDYYNWTAQTGYVQMTGGSSYKEALTSPQLIFSANEVILFEVARYGGSSYTPGLIVEFSADGSDWTTYTGVTIDNENIIYGTWTPQSVTIPSADVKYIRFNGYYLYLRNIYGGELYVPDGAKFAIDPTGTAQDLGLTAIGGNLEKTFTISNAGNEDLTVTFTAPDGFSVVGNKTTFILTDNFGWGTAKVYAWDANQNPLNGAWPGTVDAETVTNDMNQTQFKVVVPNGAVGVIVNNGNGAQTENITNFSSYEGFWMDGSKDSEGHYKVTGWGTYSNPTINSLTVPAGESKSFTVKMNTATAGAKSGTLSLALSNNVLDATSPYEIELSGVVMPADANVVDFNDNQLPAGWGNNASNKWSFADGKAYCTSAAELTTPKLQFAEGDFFVISATSYDNYDNNYIEITGSTDGSDWSAFETKKFVSRSQIPYGSYASLVITGIPTTVKYLKFKGYYVRIDEIAGLTFSDDAPVLGYYTDSECTTAATATVTKDFGFVTEAPAAQVYYIKNDGTGTMTIALGDVPTGFTAALGKGSLTAGESTTLTINMPADTKGYHNGNIVVTAKNSSDEEIGTFTVTATGVMMEDGKLNVNFANAADQRPAGWTGWTVTTGENGYIYSGGSSSELVTTALTAAAGGEKLIISASGDKNSWSSAAELKVYTKTGDAEWSAATDLTSNLLSTSTWYTLTVDVPEGDNLIKFEGKNVYIQRIYGLTAVAVAVMETTAANIAFGMQTTESEEQSFTITNTGDADLTNLSIALGKTDAEAEYAIRMTKDDADFTGTTLAKNETVTVYVKQLFDLNNLGAKSDVLTIAADGQTTKTINLTGTTRDPSVLYVDFDDPNAFPEGWQAGANWSVYTYGTDRYAYQSSSSTASALVTTPLTMETGKVLSFKVARYQGSTSNDPRTTSLKTRYSQDGGATWSGYTAQYGDGSSNEAGSQYTTIELTELPTGDLIFEFYGNNIKLDMIQGLKLATAPALALTESDAAVVNGSTKAFENLKAEGTATYTLKNIGNASMTSTVAITGGATVAISGEGEGVTISDKTVTLAAGKSAKITLTVPFESPYDDMSGAMTITTEGWVGDFAVNYTATLVDPTDFVEDFESGKPDGWYSEWSYSNGVAYVYAGTSKVLITKKVYAKDGKNVLSFKAKTYSGETGTLAVYTTYDPRMIDRNKWKEPATTFNLTNEFQEFSLDALRSGNYYLKFESANAVIDDVEGLGNNELPIRDLYAAIPTMTKTNLTPGESLTSSIKVTNVRNEIATNGVYAKWWYRLDAEGTGFTQWGDATAAQDIDGNGNATFSITRNAPTEEGTYIWLVQVLYSNDGMAYESEHYQFSVAHTHTMAITTFPNAAAVQADDNNQYTGTFFVTVENTGSASIAAEDVSVSLIDNAKAENVFTSTWTAENSNVLYMNTKKDATDIATDCTLKAWCWNTNEDGEWRTFVNVNDGFWSLDLNGKTNFKICRFNPNGTDEDPWKNVYNQSGDLSLASGNLVKFASYNGNAINFTSESMAYLEPTMTTTLKVTVNGTLADGEDASFTFKAKENYSDTYYGNGLTSSVSITAAPVIELDEAVGTISSTGANRKVTLKRTFVAGWNTICLPFTVTDLSVFGQGTTAYEFSEYTNGEIQFTDVKALVAGTPYLLKVPAAKTDAIEFSNVTVSSDLTEVTKDGITFQGTYTGIIAGDMDASKYSVTDKGNLKAGDGAHALKGFRAYFTGINSTARLSINEGEGQGIAGVVTDGGMNTEVYNLNGQRVETLKKGQLYIINGKKQVVK